MWWFSPGIPVSSTAYNWRYMAEKVTTIEIEIPNLKIFQHWKTNRLKSVNTGRQTVASDFGLGGGFCQVFRFLSPLTSPHEIWQKVTIIETEIAYPINFLTRERNSVASDLGLGGGFRQVFRFLPLLKTHEIWLKVTIIEIEITNSVDFLTRKSKSRQ